MQEALRAKGATLTDTSGLARRALILVAVLAVAACSPQAPTGPAGKAAGAPAGSTVPHDAPAPKRPASEAVAEAPLPGDAPPSAGAGPFCADYSAFDRIITGDGVDFSPEEAAGSARRYGAEAAPLLEAMGQSRPAELAGPVEDLTRLVLEAAATSSREALGSPARAEALGRLNAFALANCGWQRAEITGVDFAFSGVPETLRPGTVAFELTNESTAIDHNMVVLKVADGAASPEEISASGTFVGSASAGPGGTDQTFVRLAAPGRYALLCLVSVDDSEDSPDHSSLGMAATFTVA